MSPSPACDDDTASSSTTLAGFSGRVSSCMGERRLCLLWVIKCRPRAYVTTRCRRARLFITYDDTVYCNICSHVHHKELANRWEVS